MTRLLPEYENEYVRYHEQVWPKVLETIAECRITNYSIFLSNGFLFSYFEYHGSDYEADMRKMAASTEMQRWWKIMNPTLAAVDSSKPEELWTPMRGPHRLFLQALIHFAVAFYHQQRSNPLGAERQLRKALRKLEPFLPTYEGADTATLHREGQACLRRIQAGEAPAPPRMLLQRLFDG